MRHPIVVFLPVVWLTVAMTVAAPANEQLLVSTQWLQQHIGSRRVTVIEIGERTSYESGHIAGARFIALSDLLVVRDSTPNELPDVSALEKTMRAAGIPNRGRIILYGRDLIAASRAFFTLDYRGHGHRIALLDGGFAKWTGEGRIVESGLPPAATTVDFAASPRPESLVRLSTLRILLNRAVTESLPLAMVDARPPAQFSGSESGADVIRAGHIPAAVNVPWQTNVTGVTPVFRRLDELRVLYRDAGVADDAPVVTYAATTAHPSCTAARRPLHG